MKLLSAKTMIPATAIAVGTTLAISQPGSAAESDIYLLDSYTYTGETLNYPDLAYSDQSSQRQTYPAYHYAYYYVARPEYIL